MVVVVSGSGEWQSDSVRTAHFRRVFDLGIDLRRLRAEELSFVYIFTIVRVLRWYILVQRDLSP